MNKVGLALVTYKDNFGSALQTYATQNIIQKLGYQAECINIDGVMREIEARKRRYYIRRIFQKEEFKYLLAYSFSRLSRQGNGTYAESMRIRRQAYKRFYDQYLNFSKHCSTMDELTSLCSDYYAVLVGSDQLWRPSNIAGGFFTLEFVPNEINKIAYSTSFGVGALHKSIEKQAFKFLSRINHISVREETGKEIVRNITGKEVPVVCDPTMLLTVDDWRDIDCKKPLYEGNYILCYLMGPEKRHREFVKRLKVATNCRIIGLLHGSTYLRMDEEWPDEKPYDIGPREFLNLVRYAKYICTDSFHCCVFSILYEVPFFVFRRDKENRETSSNDRIYTLLSWTGLSERLLTGDEEVEDYVDQSIDFSNVKILVEEKREQSMAFLTKALER